LKQKHLFFFRSVASIVDQVLLSGLNFAIGIALIRYASKETYGLYSQLFAGSLLATTLLGALIGAALTTLAARLEPEKRRALVANNLRVQWAASMVFALLAGIGVSVLSFIITIGENPWLLAITFGGFIFTSGCREYCRTAFFIESKTEIVVILDAIFVCTTIISGGFLLWLEKITAINVMGILALTNGIVAIIYSSSLFKISKNEIAWKKSLINFKEMWSLSKWALSGSIIGWTSNNSYLYLAGGFLGSAALADVNASRLLLIPISMLGMAWSKVAFPVFGQMIAEKNWLQLKQFIIKSTLILEIFTVLYMTILFLFLPWFSVNVLSDKYQNISDLIILWGIYFFVNVARNVSGTLLFSFGIYRTLFWQGVSMLPILFICCLVLMPNLGAKGAVCAMIIVEILEFLINWIYLLPRAKHGKLII
jgi:O-antigen/teichoic acid export membrane protein